jgi:fused signal recognition particle receptor
MHTKANLMAELQKVKRTLGKHDPDAPHETLLVVDATTGANALSQAREFQSAIGLTGLIVTKLDGSGKGGIVVAIQDELGIPTRFIGTGEKIDDFAPFDGREFLANML